MTAPSVADLPLVSGHLALDLVNTVEPRLPVAGRHEHLAAPADVLAWARHVRLVNAAEARAVAGAWDAAPASAERALAAVRQIREALSTVLSAVLAGRAAAGRDATAGRDAAGRDATAGRDTRGRDDGGQADAAGRHAGVPLALEPGGPTGEPAGRVAAELEYLAAAWAAAAARSRLELGGSGGAAARLSVGSAPALLIPDRVAHAAVDLLCQADLTHLAMCPAEDGGCGWLFLDSSRNHSRRWCTMEACGSFVKARRLTERRRAARSATGKTKNVGS